MGIEFSATAHARVRLGVRGSTLAREVGTLPRRPATTAPATTALRCAQINYSGMLPCFLAGIVSRLVCSISSAWARRGRVSPGSMMSSRKPLLAAM